MSIESVIPSSHLILCLPLLLPSIFPSIRVFSNESLFHIRWPKYWSFSFSISLSNEYSGMNSIRIDWLDHQAVQETLKSLLQYYSLKTSILQHSAFFIVQLSHPYMTTRKTIALTRWTCVGKVMYLLFNMLSRLVITFLPRSKRLNFMAAVTICSDFGAQKNKVCHGFPSICHEVMGLDIMILVSECRVLIQLHSPLSLSSRGSLVLLHFRHKGGVICVSEVIDISPGNLIPACASFSPAFLMMCCCCCCCVASVMSDSV